MTEKMKTRLADLRARQQAGEHLLCPRCGQDNMKASLYTNALSRHIEDIYICPSCGTAEAMLDFMKQELPLIQWAVFRPLRPASGFQSMTAADVLAKVIADQIPTLTHTYELCRDDPAQADEYRAEAFESCPGLTQLWTDPFVAQYDTMDVPVMIRFRTTADGGTEFSADIMTDKKNE